MARMTGVRIYVTDIIQQIPEGSVITVPDLARHAGASGGRRAVRRIVTDRPDDLPYWRVVEKDGSLLAVDESFRSDQRERLEDEGIEIEEDGVELDQVGWEPEE